MRIDLVGTTADFRRFGYPQPLPINHLLCENRRTQGRMGEVGLPIGVSDPMHVLICGGGVIGASIAYFLSCRGVKATVIEGTGLACASSGKSGGFLALDWSDGSPLAPLARRSFALHAELAEEIAGDWGYRRLDTYGG